MSADASSRQSMLVTLSGVPSLTRWGIGPDADLIYRTLRGLGRMTVAALARELGLPIPRVSEAIGELKSVGAITQTAAGDWIGQTPDIVTSTLELLTRPRQAHGPGPAPVTPNHITGSAGHGALAEVMDSVRDSGAAGFIGNGLRLLTRDLTRQRLANLVSVARHEHLALNPELSFEVASAQAAAPMDRMLASRGLSIRALGAAGAASEGAPGDSHRAPTAQYRELSYVPMKLIIVDRRVALFPVDPLNYDRGYLEISQEPVVLSLVAMFDMYWANAQEPEPYRPGIVVSPREQLLISLLASGHTDATAARQMRISERSVSSTVRSLMDRVGVQNRFQLGLVLGALRAVPNLPVLPRVQPLRKLPSELPR